MGGVSRAYHHQTENAHASPGLISAYRGAGNSASAVGMNNGSHHGGSVGVARELNLGGPPGGDPITLTTGPGAVGAMMVEIPGHPGNMLNSQTGASSGHETNNNGNTMTSETTRTLANLDLGNLEVPGHDMWRPSSARSLGTPLRNLSPNVSPSASPRGAGGGAIGGSNSSSGGLTSLSGGTVSTVGELGDPQDIGESSNENATWPCRSPQRLSPRLMRAPHGLSPSRVARHLLNTSWMANQENIENEEAGDQQCANVAAMQMKGMGLRSPRRGSPAVTLPSLPPVSPVRNLSIPRSGVTTERASANELTSLKEQEEEGEDVDMPSLLQSLPEEALVLVLLALPPPALCSLAMCSTWLRTAASSDELWQPLFAARWRWRPNGWALAVAANSSGICVVPPLEEPSPGEWRAAFAARQATQNRPPLMPRWRAGTLAGRPRRSALGLTPRAPKLVLVDPMGNGAHCTTIPEALSLARNGDVVLLAPGTYFGSVSLPSGVELRGGGTRSTVMIVTDDEPALAYNRPGGPGALVTNVTLWRQSSASGGTLAGAPPVACVLVSGGSIRLDSCNIVSAGEGVVVDPAAHASVISCDISSVLSGYVAAGGELHGCAISSAAADDGPQDAIFAAVTILSGVASICNNRIVYGTAHGVAVLDGASGSIRANVIASNAGAGICIGTSADPTIEDCLIADNGGHGVAVYNDGQGKVLRCEVQGNSHSGVDINGRGGAGGTAAPVDPSTISGCPRVEGCHVHNNGRDGMTLSAGGYATVKDCEIAANSHANVSVGTAAALSLEQSRIVAASQVGISITDPGTRCTMFNCIVKGSAWDNILVSNWADPSVLGCEVAEAKQAGVRFATGGTGTVRGSNIHSNSGPGVAVQGWGAPTIEWCHVHHGRTDGVVFNEGSKGVLRNSRIRRNEESGVWVRNLAAPNVMNNRISRNGRDGVRLGDSGEGGIHGTSDDAWYAAAGDDAERHHWDPEVRDLLFRGHGASTSPEELSGGESEPERDLDSEESDTEDSLDFVQNGASSD